VTWITEVADSDNKKHVRIIGAIAMQSVEHHKYYAIGGIATHHCKKGKDGDSRLCRDGEKDGADEGGAIRSFDPSNRIFTLVASECLRKHPFSTYHSYSPVSRGDGL
jgi:hypothetical protein